ARAAHKSGDGPVLSRPAPHVGSYSSAVRVPFFSSPPATPEPYTLSLHDALPISTGRDKTNTIPCSFFLFPLAGKAPPSTGYTGRSEEHTSELQSRFDLVCRLLLEKKKRKHPRHSTMIYRYRVSTARHTTS